MFIQYDIHYMFIVYIIHKDLKVVCVLIGQTCIAKVTKKKLIKCTDYLCKLWNIDKERFCTYNMRIKWGMDFNRLCYVICLKV